MNRRLIRIATLAALTLTATMGLASSAKADHHLIMVREVHRGATAAGDYVMLQMFADGENVALNTHYIDILDTGGMANAEYPLPTGMIGQNQRTILIGNTGVAGADFSDPGVVVPAQGAVCYDENGTYNGTNGIDCVAWGNFTGSTHPLSSPALPVALSGGNLGTNQSLVRTISRGCATQLDAADDTNNSAADFALGAPIGRNNATTPTEKPCTGAGASTCAGKAATIVGTDGNDTLKGTPRADVISGLGGNDVIKGLAGNDTICGGPGKDKLLGGKGNDKLLGQAGKDTLIGGAGKDKLKGGPGKDVQVQ
jgi:Ca2+-binding RTX toxin-like protein